MASLILIRHRCGTAFLLRWSYGFDLGDVEVTVTVSAPSGEIGRLKVLTRDDATSRDLMATASETARWPLGLLAIDVRLRRGSTTGRLDTFFVEIT